MNARIAAIRQLLHNHFILRWTLANMLGLPAGLVIGLLFPRLLGMNESFLSVLFTGGLAGAVVGAAQQYALVDGDGELGDVPVRRWWLASALGMMIGAGVAYVLAVILVFVALLGGGWALVFAIVGLVVGTGAGMAQWVLLADHVPDSGWWVAANGTGGLVGGLFAAWLTLPPLPLLCSAGPIIFGLITGAALLQILRR